MNNNFSIANQCNCYQICYRNSNFITISRDMRCTGINIKLLSNIRKKRISDSAGIQFRGYLIWGSLFGFETFREYKSFRENGEKLRKSQNLVPVEFNTLKISSEHKTYISFHGVLFIMFVMISNVFLNIVFWNLCVRK